MSINIKKYTKDQMAKMVEEAQSAQKEAETTAATYFKDGAKLAEENEKLCEQIGKMETQEQELRAKNAALTEQIEQMNGEAINRVNEIANLKADAGALRNKLADTEAALERANAELTYSVTEKNELNAKIKQLGGNLHYHKSRSDELDYYKNLLSNANEAQAQIRDNLAKAHWERYNAQERANYAEAHPWRNLWAWVKRKLVRHK